MMLLSRDRLHSLLSAAFLMLAPFLLDRINHIALCSHWLILALILWNLSSATAARSSEVYYRKATGLNLLAAVTHPYIWAMTFVLSLPLFARPRRSGAAGVASSFAFWSFIQIALAVLGWWTFGYLVSGSVEAEGFGDYGGDLLGLLNSAGRTALAPELTTIKPQQEAFDFIGLGILLIAAILAANVGEAADGKRPPWRERGRSLGWLAA